MNTLLKIEELSVIHPSAEVSLLHPVNLSLNKGEVLAIVGASGSGKSLFAQSIFQIVPKNLLVNGHIYFKNRLIQKDDNGKNIAYIPQSIDGLNPLMKVGKQIEGLMTGGGAQERSEKLLKQLGLEEHVAKKFPFQLSGGQARRVLVAIALGSSAEVVVADEPTPGLDESAKSDMLSLLSRISQAEKGLIMITHDFGAALQLGDRIAVMNEGRIVEITDKHAFSGEGENLQHPYSKALWKALPQNEFTRSL